MLSMSLEGPQKQKAVIAEESVAEPEVTLGSDLAVEPQVESLLQQEQTAERGEHQDTPEEEVVEEGSIDPQKEAYAFSKEFSREYRSRLAKELWSIRKKHRVEVPAENESRAKLRELIDEKLEVERERVILADHKYTSAEDAEQAAKVELQEREREVAELESQLENEKSSIVNKIKGWVGLVTPEWKTERELSIAQDRAVAVAEDARFKESELVLERERRAGLQASGEYRVTSLWQESGRVQDIVLDEVETDVLKQKINDFYTKQLEVKNDWETTQAERSINRQAKQHNVVFLHGLPQGEFMANTAENNPTLKTSELSAKAKADLVVGLEPTISVSTFSLDEDKESKLMYPSGLIIGEGTVMSAFEEDAATYAESFDIKFPKYDEQAVSSVQQNPTEAMAEAVAQEGRRTLPWNEIVVRRPKVAGAFIYKGSGGPEDLIKQLELAEHLGVPLVQIEHGQPMRDLLTGEIVDQEELMLHADACSVEDRLQYADDGLAEAYAVPGAESAVAPTRKLADERIERIKAEGGVVPQERQSRRMNTLEQAREALQALRLRNAAEDILYWNKAAQGALSQSGDALFDHLMALSQEYTVIEPLLRGKSSEEATVRLKEILVRADTILARHEGRGQTSEALAA